MSKSELKLYFTTKEHRLGLRRKVQATSEFQTRYSKRSGIEGTNSGLKRRIGLGHLRVRGSPAVTNSLLLKVTGWNVLRASTTQTLRALACERLLKAGRLGGLIAVFSHFEPLWNRFSPLCAFFTPNQRDGLVKLSLSI